jgi:hypothetical protein
MTEDQNEIRALRLALLGAQKDAEMQRTTATYYERQLSQVLESALAITRLLNEIESLALAGAHPAQGAIVRIEMFQTIAHKIDKTLRP